MRYLGNKETLTDEIIRLLTDKKITDEKLVFFDAFCGTGSVANAVKNIYKTIYINDNLEWATSYSMGRLKSTECSSKKLISKLISFSKKEYNGFITKNYSFGPSNRMYFSEKNGIKIDTYRAGIETLFSEGKIDEIDRDYLLYRLLEAISDVSNTAGVYGAFLKHWDSRALKELELNEREDIKSKQVTNVIKFNDFLENIIKDVDCDILYLDPPYTQNQYGTQYHLLETIVKNDNPSISAITGSRPTGPMRSDWSKEYKVHILLEKILAETKAKYVVLSYSNDGLMSKKYIESLFKRYGIESTYECRKINYKKYENWKSENDEKHFEYLFFVKLKNKNDVIIESPLNYIGSKFKLISEIKKIVSSSGEMFMDVFGGGFNVGINMNHNYIQYNDINFFVKDLLFEFYSKDTYLIIKKIKSYIKKYGLEPKSETPYLTLRNYYNSISIEKRDSLMLYTLMLYGFQQQLRFNNHHEFNNPIGMRWFNDCVLEKLISFSRLIKTKQISFSCVDFRSLNYDCNSFFYFDPPYSLTTGSYNDGKRGFNGWSKKDELDLLKILDYLNENNKKFLLSYVVEHKGVINHDVIEWVKSNKYNIVYLEPVVGISGSKRKEVLIYNYE